MPLYGIDSSQVLCGGYARDTLRGSMEADVLVGGAQDDVLAGGGGADRFLYLNANAGDDVIEDFSLAEGDCIDLARVLQGVSGRLEDYVTLSDDGTNSHLAVNVDGTGAPFDSFALTVAGTELAQADPYSLLENGHLQVGDKALIPSVSLVAIQTACSENGPRSAEIRVRRRGDLNTAITVTLGVSGSAQNGVDYSLLPTAVVLPAGEDTLSILVEPYVDTLTELTEVVEEPN